MNSCPVLLTGSAGFCGRHLAAYLSDRDYLVAGFDRANKHSNSLETFYAGDITVRDRIRTALRETQPNVIFHLAALTDSRLDYEELHRVNALGTLSILGAAREMCPDSVILCTSSSAVYGRASPDILPISEDQPFAPTNPYAASKVAQEMIAYQQFARHALHIIRTRAFNLTGPGESAHFVTSAFACQIAEIEAGLREPIIRVGNLDSVRDFTDVRDVVRAYQLLAKKGEPGEVYNICSGQGISIRNLLDTLLDLSTESDISVQVDSSRLQPADVPIQVGDANKLRALTGWSPAIPLRQTLEDVLDYWRMYITEELK